MYGNVDVRDFSCQHSATGSLRPDYAFLLNKLCPFQGEEEAPGSSNNPKAELANKLVWAYSPAPYVLGLLKTLADLIQPADAEFEVLERDHCTVEIAGGRVIKVFTSPERVPHLRNMYSLLGSKNIPHVDSLVHHFDMTVVLSPRGIAELPKTEKELLAALICVLEALEASRFFINHHQFFTETFVGQMSCDALMIHRGGLPLIGMMQLSLLQQLNPTLTGELTTLVFLLTGMVQTWMWGVGELIRKCGVLDISLELKNFGKWMQGSIAPSTQEALGKIKDYQSSHS
ncbi:hypothetical protein BU17DRAFT_85664 [Hysterangium stoloniferum]|nr:hypothetical protein BU17DRAFT_85664 [Hysterangium stoloniferum]